MNLKQAGAILSTLLLLFLTGREIVKFVEWSGRREYSLIAADRDLKAILAANAVISGSYATAFTQENNLGCVIHMFGVKRVDQEFFHSYPITHLAIDEGNEKRARQDYPEIMEQAAFVTRYYARGFPVRVYRISETTPNQQARNYHPTDYELAQGFIAANNNDSASFYLERYLQKKIPNLSANMYVGDALSSQTKYVEALPYYRKAAEFAPYDAMANLRLGYAYIGVAGRNNNPAYFDSAYAALKIAAARIPSDRQLQKTVTELANRKR